MTGNPYFSIITPVYDPPVSALEVCAESIFGQTDVDWEWIITDDASRVPAVIAKLNEWSRHPRVTLHRLDSNSGISAASNRSIESAAGSYLAFVDHDDELDPEALEVVRQAIARTEGVDLLYSDEVKISDSGELYGWFAKPAWSPERLRCQNYCNHLSVVRTDLVRHLGGLRSEFDGAQDHDLLLRISELNPIVCHIPRVLYRWRATPMSTANSIGAKPAALDAGRRAVQAHFDRVGISAEVEVTSAGRYLSRRRLADPPAVSIVIPTRGETARVLGRPVNLVVNAVESIVATTAYPNVEFVVVYDDTTPAVVLDRLRELCGAGLVLVPWHETFSFSRKVNLGVLRSRGDVIVLLNDDTEVVTPDWLEVLVALVLERDVGMVGPMLLFGDGRVQSAGHYSAGTPLHLGTGAPFDDEGPNGMFTVTGERSGVTAACAAIRRNVFYEVGGLSEELAVAYNDVDLGFKLLDAGYRIVWTPNAQLIHFESMSRDPRETTHEARELEQRWGTRLLDDAYTRQVEAWWAQLPLLPPESGPTR